MNGISGTAMQAICLTSNLKISAYINKQTKLSLTLWIIGIVLMNSRTSFAVDPRAVGTQRLNMAVVFPSGITGHGPSRPVRADLISLLSLKSI